LRSFSSGRASLISLQDINPLDMVFRAMFASRARRETPKAKPSIYTGVLRFLRGRIVLVLAFLFAAQVQVGAQAKTDFFDTVKLQVMLTVKKHQTGADLVDVTVLDTNYPPDLLQKQITAMCAALDAPARGLQVFRISYGSDKLEFVRASFGTIGLNEGNGRFNLQPIARAFAGGPAPFQISGIDVIFSDERPTEQTVRSLDSTGVRLEARYNEPPAAGTEFRIALRTQDPSAIEIADHYVASEKPAPAAPKSSSGALSEVLLWVMFLIAALAIGALVYWALLRITARGRKSPPGSNK
jgi:hypothetical protein